MYDADTAQHSSIALVTSGSSADGFYDELVNISGNAGTFISATDPLVDWTGATSLSLSFASALSNAGGTVSVFSVDIGTCNDSVCFSRPIHPTDQAFIYNGDIGTLTASPVPVPAAVWLFGSGLVLLARLRRRD